MDLIRDAIAFLSDAYWATGFLVVLGGFVLFIGDVVSHYRPRRTRPRVVNVTVERGPEARRPGHGLAGNQPPRLQRGRPQAALPSGTVPREGHPPNLDEPVRDA